MDQGPVSQAVTRADAVILAVPYGAAAEILQDAAFDGKIVIDATNPLVMGPNGLGLSLGFESSGAERLAAAAPKVRLVKTFNQTGFENMGDARVYPFRPVMFAAGDDDEARSVALSLVADAGFDAIDLGALRQARLLEPFAMLWIELARKGEFGPGFVFTLLRKE
jgi:predicted dinucleotide-binding enzyme